MWPFPNRIKKESVSLEAQILSLKSFSVPELTPRWKLNHSTKRADWNTETAICEGYNASAVVYACIEKRAKLVSSVPWKAMFGAGDDKKHRPDSPLQQLIDNPNPDQSWLELMYRMSQQIDLSGDGIFTEVRRSDGSPPIALWLQNSHGIEVKPGATRLVESYKINRKSIPAEDICHIRLPSPSSQIFGQPILMASGRAADIDREGAGWQKSGLQNRGILDVVIQVPEGTTTEERENAKKMWLKRQSGAENARKPVVTSGDIKQLGTTAAEMDFVNSRKSVWSEIAASFGVPLASIGFTENVNLANAKEMNRSLWINTVVPQLELYKRQFDKQLAIEFGQGWTMEPDLSGVEALQEDLSDKLTNAERLLRMGYTRNEINDRLGLGFDWTDGGDIRFEPLGLLPAGEDINLDEEGTDEEKRKLSLVMYGKT